MICIMVCIAPPFYAVHGTRDPREWNRDQAGKRERSERRWALSEVRGLGSRPVHRGLMRVLTVRNTKSARVGDLVRIGLVRRVQFTGYVLAYVLPASLRRLD